MGYWRKNPVRVQATQYHAGETTINGLLETFGVPKAWRATIADYFFDIDGDQLWIETLEGKMRASDGDWIIMGVQGEFYPCKPDIFAATYIEDPAGATQ